ncbi:9380_t:CDS:2, partial [Dentiscutata erythropus]
MSSLFGLVVRLSRPAPRIFRPVALFSSASTLFDKELSRSRELVKEMLREKGRTFKSGDLKALNVSFKSAGCNNQIVPDFD